MSKKIFIVPNNDAEAIRIQKLINENNTGEWNDNNRTRLAVLLMMV